MGMGTRSGVYRGVGAGLTALEKQTRHRKAFYIEKLEVDLSFLRQS